MLLTFLKDRYRKISTKQLKINPAQILSIGFFALILVGTLLLMLPFATEDRHHLSFIDALFEATSAVCVTGLVVVDTETTFTMFGQIVLLVLIQVGGLGFMTVGILVALFLGKNIGLQGRLMIKESLNQLTLEGMVRLVKFIVGLTFLIEGVGAIILALRWVHEFGVMKAIYYGIFHSISAFNNAGFDLMGNYSSLTSYVGDFTVIITISLLLMVGGIGYIVILDLYKKRSFRSLSLHTKLVLLMTAILIVIGPMLIFILEFNNPSTLGKLPLNDKILGALFHGIVPRTAGFNSLNTADLTLSSQFVTMSLMFIGGGSGGTAGGIKVTTFVIIVLAVWAVIRGNDEVNIMKRRLPRDLIYRAFAITVYSTGIVFFTLFMLTITEKSVPLNVLLFEVISAFGTVGMSLGLTPELSTAGKIVIAIVMFIGRVGPLTLAFALANANRKLPYKFVEEKVMIG